MLEVAQYISAHVDEDLTLDALAARFGLGKYQLHRRFKDQLGETLAQFVARVRLAQAADALVLHDASVLQIALEVGFNHHETFTRAFQRQFGLSPSGFRASGRWRNQVQTPVRVAADTLTWQLSRTRLQKLQHVAVATRRYVGPYDQAPVTLWSELAQELERDGINYDLSVGIGYDANIGALSRFDAGLTVAHARPHDGQLPGGWYAVCTYIGPLIRLGQAYELIFAQAAQLENCQLIGLPVIEVYHTSLVDGPHVDQTRRTDIYVPVLPSGDDGTTITGDDITDGKA